MRGSTLFICFATLLCIKNARALQTDYMDGYATRIDLSAPRQGYYSSGILKAHFGLRYSSNMNKTFNVSVPAGYSLVISIRLIDLRPMKQDQLTIFAINGQVSPVSFTNTYYYRNRRYYPQEEITFFAPSGKVGIRFTTGPSYTTHGYDGFELVYTAVENAYRCSDDLFSCKNGRCIARSLTCDGHNHCGDLSSLKNCGRHIGPGSSIGISIGCIFLIIAAGCGIYIAVRKMRQDGSDSQTIITSHPPPANLPSYPPAYPQPGTYYPPPPPPYSQGVANPTYH